MRSSNSSGCHLLLLLLVGASGLATNAEEGPQPPAEIRVTDIHYSAADARLSFALRNDSTQTVTAWAVDDSGADALGAVE